MENICRDVLPVVSKYAVQYNKSLYNNHPAEAFPSISWTAVTILYSRAMAGLCGAHFSSI